MLFADLFFIYGFLAAFAASYILAQLLDRSLKYKKAENAVLLVFSLLFYAWGEPVYVLLLLAAAGICFLSGWLHHERVGIAALILILIGFKYSALILSLMHISPARLPSLPIGISFYSFQCISYLADVRAGRVKAQKDPITLLLYICMFPQLIAGPIVRYSSIEKELHERSICADDVAEGIVRFVYGLAKKVLLADQLSVLVEQTLGGDVGSLSSGLVWLGLIAYSLEIYFDFSGYSDMAIGMGRCMGFHFPENFDHPYLCSSVTDFWRRWHITLGIFFRDYVYIPLGGNRVGAFRRIVNVLLVWMLTGLWHGASLNYALWGLYFGVLLLLERGFKKFILKQEGKPAALIHRLLGLLAVVFGWGIFYFEDMGRLKLAITRLAAVSGEPQRVLLASLLKQNLILLAAGIVLCLPFKKRDSTLWTIARSAFCAVLLCVCTMLLVASSNHPFLYTRF